MRRKVKMWIAAVLALSLAAPALAGDPKSARVPDVELWINANIAIAADGSIETLAWRDSDAQSRRVHEQIEKLVRSWQFAPGVVDGVPSRTETVLTVKLLGEDIGNGEIALRIGSAETGPWKRKMVSPTYPSIASRRGVSALAMVYVDVDAKGAVSVRSLEIELDSNRHREQFLGAIRSAVLQWTFEQETVGGHPVAASMRIPVSFCASSGWCEKRKREKLESGEIAASAPAGEPAALASAARLLTVVSGQEI